MSNIAYFTSDGVNVLAPGIDAPMPRDEAEALGFEVRRVAFAFAGAHGKERVRFADFNTSSRENAEAAGFAVEPMPEAMRAAIERERAASARPTRRPAATVAAVTEPAPAPAAAPPTPISAWAAEIIASDKSILRSDATATLLEIHTEKTLSAAMAVAMLGALPIEHYNFDQPTTEDQMATLNASAAIVRAAELRQSALAMRGQRGDANAHAEANKLSVALHNHRTANVGIVEALHTAGADVNAVADLAKRAH